MSTSRHCPECHAPLVANAPEGLCPQCLLKAAAGPPPGSGLPADIIDIGDAAAVAAALPQFEILELLGRGGMGGVYKARQRQLDRVVALKILPPVDALSPDFVARFTREAQSLAKLNHPNIVAIYDFGESGGLYFFSMEFVDGVNLRKLLADQSMPAAQALAIVPKVCDALAYAHEEGVVHRDIKPENILIDKKGRVKIADFGLAKLLRREALDLTLTGTGVMLGTVRYMAPEQMDKPETVDHRADIYSLGVVLYEMLTGDVPMGRFAPPSQTAGVDARLDEIVLHALEREPERRYQHVSEVKTDVENVTQPVAAAGAPARQIGGRGASRWRTFFRRLWDESFIGKAALLVALVALDARKHPWHSLIGPDNQVLSPANSLVVSANMSTFMLGLALVSALFASAGGLAGLARMVVRALAGIFTMAALWFQISFLFTLGKWEPGLTGKVLRETQSYPQPGLYVTITLSALALLFFVLRFFEEKGAEKRDSVAGATVPPAKAVRTPGETLVLLAGVSLLAALGLLLWKALAKLPEAFPEAVAVAITLAGHGIFVGAAGWFMRKLRARMFVLGCLVLAGLFVPAAMAVNVIMELERIPQWPVAIPLWLAMPACVWAITLLFRDDVREAFAAEGDILDPATPRRDEPRLSRCALLGLIWAPWTLTGWWAWQMCLRQYFDNPSRFETYSAAYVMAGVIAGILAGTAPLGSTILGGLAVAQIKRSNGKLYGLPLAAAALLAHTLAAIFAATALITIEIVFAIFDVSLPKMDGVPGVVFPSLPGLIVCFFVGRAAWRKIAGIEKPAQPWKIPLFTDEPLTGKAALIIALTAAMAHASPWHWIIPPNNHSLTIANSDIMEAKQSLLLVMIAFGFALFAAAQGVAMHVKRIMRGLGAVVLIGALFVQGRFLHSLGEWVPGQEGTVVRLTRSYSHTGIYATIALTALALLFFVLRFFEEKAATTVPLATTPPREPRLSRCALWGVILACVGIPFEIVLPLAINDTPKGTVLGGILHVPVWLWAIVAISPPIGSTILGGVAVAQIKRFVGKLHGLPLAATAFLAHPVAALGSLAFGLTHLAQIAFWTKVHTGYSYEMSGKLVGVSAPPPGSYPGMTFMILDSMCALAVCFFAARAGWRAIARSSTAITLAREGDASSTAPSDSR